MTDNGPWKMNCDECGRIGYAYQDGTTLHLRLKVRCHHNPTLFWTIECGEEEKAVVKKQSAECPVSARVRRHDLLQPGEIMVLDGILKIVSCPKCGAKSPPVGTTFLLNVGSTAGEPFACPGCKYKGRVVDGSWKRE